ncbi:14582_t:CDS:2, partial [Dentiscutata heterogama]
MAEQTSNNNKILNAIIFIKYARHTVEIITFIIVILYAIQLWKTIIHNLDEPITTIEEQYGSIGDNSAPFPRDSGIGCQNFTQDLYILDNRFNEFSGLLDSGLLYYVGPYFSSSVYGILINISTKSPPNSHQDYFDYFELTINMNETILNDNQYNYYFNAKHPIPRGQLLVLEFSIRFKKFYNDQANGMFALSPDTLYGYIEFKEKKVFPLINASYSILELVPAMPPFRLDKVIFQKHLILCYQSLEASLVFFATLLIYLFGDSKLNP